MAICGECKERIGHLISEATATTGCVLYEDGTLDLNDEDLNSIIEINEWRCPECDEIVAYNEDEAREFLEEKDELKEIVVEKLKK